MGGTWAGMGFTCDFSTSGADSHSVVFTYSEWSEYRYPPVGRRDPRSTGWTCRLRSASCKACWSAEQRAADQIHSTIIAILSAFVMMSKWKINATIVFLQSIEQFPKTIRTGKSSFNLESLYNSDALSQLPKSITRKERFKSRCLLCRTMTHSLFLPPAWTVEVTTRTSSKQSVTRNI